MALPVDPNEKPPLVVAGAPLPPPRVLGVPNEKPPLVLVSILPAVAELGVSFTDANGFLGAAVLIGGKALLEAVDLDAGAAGAGAGGFEEAENGFLGAAVLIGGKALLVFEEVDLDAGAAVADAGAGGFEEAENGFLGAAVLIGGKADAADAVTGAFVKENAGGFVVAPKLNDEVPAGFAPNEKADVGAGASVKDGFNVLDRCSSTIASGSQKRECR